MSLFLSEIPKNNNYAKTIEIDKSQPHWILSHSAGSGISTSIANTFPDRKTYLVITTHLKKPTFNDFIEDLKYKIKDESIVLVFEDSERLAKRLGKEKIKQFEIFIKMNDIKVFCKVMH